MLATPATANTSLIGTYDRSGKTDGHLRSEPVRHVALIPGHGSTTTEKYQDKVTLSADGLELSQSEETSGKADTLAAAPHSGGKKETEGRQPGAPAHTKAEEKMIRQLKERDQEVKAHERAHLAGAGQHARGGPTYSYQQGPDGRRYAIGGEVPIDLSKENTPEQTVQKMRGVKQAALAPAEPSSADRRIAATATALENQARQELQNEQTSRDQETRTSKNSAEPENEAPQAATGNGGSPSRRLAPDVFA